MILALAATFAVALAGSVIFPAPASAWLGWLAGTAGLVLAYIVIAAVIDGIEAWWALRRLARLDAMRRRGYR